MESEALRKIRTMRQVKTSLDVARKQRLSTTNSLSKAKEEIEHLESLTDSRVGQVLEKERRKFAAQEAVVDKSRQRVLKSRERLAAAINKNRALTELRHELQRARWEGKNPPLPKAEQSDPEQNLRRMELRY
jgi:predicted  nucleic acid-binding Zn-ribbon protein